MIIATIEIKKLVSPFIICFCLHFIHWKTKSLFRAHFLTSICCRPLWWAPINCNFYGYLIRWPTSSLPTDRNSKSAARIIIRPTQWSHKSVQPFTINWNNWGRFTSASTCFVWAWRDAYSHFRNTSTLLSPYSQWMHSRAPSYFMIYYLKNVKHSSKDTRPDTRHENYT